MSDIAITASGVGKRYRIGNRERYYTLRDSIMRTLTAPVRMVKGEREAAETEFWALKDVGFDIRHGECVGIIGRNGAGKSTLLKILSRITEVTEGQAEIHGRVGSLLEVGTGFHPELSGRENIYLNGAVLGMRRWEIERKFDEIVEFSEVGQFLDTPVKRYSSGMYMKLAFSVAAQLEPEILVVDEVLAVGDSAFQKKCLGKMSSVAKQGRTVLFVSHNLGAVVNLCSRCILLHQGRVVTVGPTSEVIQRYIDGGLAARAEFSQPNDPAKPVCLRQVSLTTPDGEVGTEFRYDEGFTMTIEYEVNQRCEGVAAWMGVKTMDEVWAFATHDCDADAGMLGPREPGYYRSVIQVPAGLLNAGNYRATIALGKQMPLISYDRVEALGFQILPIGTPSVLRYGTNRPGIFQPVLEWKTTIENEAMVSRSA